MLRRFAAGNSFVATKVAFDLATKRIIQNTLIVLTTRCRREAALEQVLA
jgi:hypothetical protein